MVAVYDNPALHEEPLNQKATAMPLRENESLLNWIEGSGRFKPYESGELISDKIVEDIEEILETSDYLDKEEEEWDQTSD